MRGRWWGQCAGVTDEGHMGKGEIRRPTVSVVICTKDREGILGECLSSIARQERLPEQVIVVDASTSPTGGAVAGFKARVGAGCPVTAVLAAPGLPRQRNIGARLARGEVVLFLDDDVVLEPGYIANVADVFARDVGREVGGVGGSQVPDPTPPVGWIGGLYSWAFLLTGHGEGRVRRSGYGSLVFSVARETDVEILSGCNMAYRREILESLSFDERLNGYALGEDIQFSYRVSRRWRLVMTPNACLEHKHAGGGRPDDRRRQEMSVFNKYLFVMEWVARSPLDWLAYGWAELGALLRTFRRPGGGRLAGRLEGYARIVAHAMERRRHRRSSRKRATVA